MKLKLGGFILSKKANNTGGNNIGSKPNPAASINTPSIPLKITREGKLPKQTRKGK